MREAGLPPLVGTVIITFRWGNLFSQSDSVILGAPCSSAWTVMVSERRTTGPRFSSSPHGFTWRFCVCPVHFFQLGCSPLPHRGVRILWPWRRSAEWEPKPAEIDGDVSTGTSLSRVGTVKAFRRLILVEIFGQMVPEMLDAVKGQAHTHTHTLVFTACILRALTEIK